MIASAIVSQRNGEIRWLSIAKASRMQAFVNNVRPYHAARVEEKHRMDLFRYQDFVCLVYGSLAACCVTSNHWPGPGS